MKSVKVLLRSPWLTIILMLVSLVSITLVVNIWVKFYIIVTVLVLTIAVLLILAVVLGVVRWARSVTSEPEEVIYVISVTDEDGVENLFDSIEDLGVYLEDSFDEEGICKQEIRLRRIDRKWFDRIAEESEH